MTFSFGVFIVNQSMGGGGEGVRGRGVRRDVPGGALKDVSEIEGHGLLHDLGAIMK
jgi:hypothetical protein